MLKQRTLQRVVKASGIGLHSGQKVLINFVPHHADGGIVFRRIDLNPPVDIRANAMLIQEAFMCSNLVQEDAKVGTIEHVMSAIAGLGIDNLIIEVSASEVPIMDGSAGPFIYLLMQGGLKELDAPKNLLKYSNLLKLSSTTNAPFSARMRVSNSTSPLTSIIPLLRKNISLLLSIFQPKPLFMKSAKPVLLVS